MKRTLVLALLLAACGRDDEKMAPYEPDRTYVADPEPKAKATPKVTPTATPSPTPAPTATPTPQPVPSVTRLVVRWKEGEVAIGWDSQGNRLPRTTEGLVQKERVFEVPGIQPVGLVMQHDSFPDTQYQLGKTLCVPTFTGTGFLQDHFTCNLDTLKRNCMIDVPAGVYRYVAPTEVSSTEPVYTLRLADTPGSGWCATHD